MLEVSDLQLYPWHRQNRYDHVGELIGTLDTLFSEAKGTQGGLICLQLSRELADIADKHYAHLERPLAEYLARCEQKIAAASSSGVIYEWVAWYLGRVLQNPPDLTRSEEGRAKAAAALAFLRPR